MDQMRNAALVLLLCLLLPGCAAGRNAALPGRTETIPAQIDAAKKIVGAMAPSRSPVEKYSPVTGRHYSGAIEFEPGTGARLVPVEE